MVEKMSELEERRIMEALRRSIKMANAGASPSEALAKTATEERFSPPVVQRMVEAFNVSKTLAHMKKTSGAARADSFPLADTEEVLAQMYPSHVDTPSEKRASAIPSSYNTPETVDFNKPAPLTVPLASLYPSEKVAAYARDPQMDEDKKWNRKRALEKTAAAAMTEYRGCINELTLMADDAGHWFKLHPGFKFAEAEKRVWAEHGQIGKSAMDMIHNLSGLNEKRAEAPPGHQVMFDPSQEPYCLIEEVIKKGFEMHDLATKAAELQDAAENFCKKANLPFVSSSPKAAEEPVEKSADMLSTVGTMGLLNAVGLKQPDPEAEKRKAVSEVMDPIHDSKVQAIKTRAMLNDLATNDPVLSGYEPHQLTSAYNQIAELAPTVAQQPAVMRGMMRRILQQEGVVEPHEAEQLSNIENNLRGQGQFESMFSGSAVGQPN